MREYDMLLRELKSLEEQYPQFRRSDSPTQRVGGAVLEGFESVRHEVPMESLQDAFSREEIEEFDRRNEELTAIQKYVGRISALMNPVTYVIINAAKNYDPAKVTHYAIELATHFHKFYNNCRIKGEDAAVANARLKLADSVRSVLRNGMELIGCSAPERM